MAGATPGSHADVGASLGSFSWFPCPGTGAQPRPAMNLAAETDRAESHVSRKLDAKMSKATNSLEPTQRDSR